MCVCVYIYMHTPTHSVIFLDPPWLFDLHLWCRIFSGSVNTWTTFEDLICSSLSIIKDSLSWTNNPCRLICTFDIVYIGTTLENLIHSFLLSNLDMLLPQRNFYQIKTQGEWTRDAPLHCHLYKIKNIEMEQTWIV